MRKEGRIKHAKREWEARELGKNESGIDWERMRAVLIGRGYWRQCTCMPLSKQNFPYNSFARPLT